MLSCESPDLIVKRVRLGDITQLANVVSQRYENVGDVIRHVMIEQEPHSAHGGGNPPAAPKAIAGRYVEAALAECGGLPVERLPRH